MNVSEVNKDTKGSQVLVSRADANLVKRLFELEVPEIYSGVVEIKAIAREAGERTKMAVYSHRPEVDAIGSCIGPRGSRVQVVIEELKGEKIDIFEWSENIQDFFYDNNITITFEKLGETTRKITIEGVDCNW